MARDDMRIGELARRADCPVETIRYYERTGLLPSPGRSSGNYRLYGERHLERLSFIRRCRSLDMAHQEIRALLDVRDAPDEDCAGANRLLDEHIGHVGQRIAELKALQRELQDLRSLCGRPHAAKNCAILNELSSPETHSRPAVKVPMTHVHGAHTGKSKRPLTSRRS